MRRVSLVIEEKNGEKGTLPGSQQVARDSGPIKCGRQALPSTLYLSLSLIPCIIPCLHRNV